jgi:PAS domain S-box-containing protein
MDGQSKETVSLRRLRKRRFRAGEKGEPGRDPFGSIPPARRTTLKPGLPADPPGKNEELFRSIFEHANAGMNTITLEGRYLQVNPAFCRFLDYTREEFSRLTVFDLTHPDDQNATRTQFAQIEAGLCQAFDYEKRFLRKDGHAVWGHVTSAWLFDESRKPLFGIGLVQDITGRKKAEADLRQALAETREARDKIDGILRSLGEGLIVVDGRQQVVLMSPSAEKLLGVACRQVVNQPVGQVFADPSIPPVLRQALTEGKMGEIFEFEIAGPSGRSLQSIQARVSAVRDHAGTRSERIVVLHDVTREREISRMKTEFVTTAAHELRTPLTSIQGFSEILLKRPDLNAEEHRWIMGVIREQAETLGKIVSDLLDLSRIEAGTGFVLNKVPCNLAKLLRQAVSHVPRRLDLHQIEICLPADLSEVHADPAKLRQVLENILSNAVKFSPGGGRILIAGRQLGSDLRLSVADQGIGMSSDQVQRIFDKFYRVDTSNSAIEGIGLGMNIVKEIIEAHEGKVWVHSSLGRGTTVNLSLPLQSRGDPAMDFLPGGMMLDMESSHCEKNTDRR